VKHGLETPSVRSFELGINYWPRRTAMYMWREFDLAEVRDELAHIADMGFDTVRMFTLTQDFLPERNCVDTRMVARLVDVVRAARDQGLTVVPTLIVLNMSGTIWWPAWMLHENETPADLYTDASMLLSQAKLVSECAGALANDASVTAFDIANEIDDAQKPPTREAARAWTSRMADAIRQVAPQTPVRIGAHLPWLTTGTNMRLDDVAAVVDEDVMHAYPLYSDHARSFLDPELVPFACALAGELAGRGRPPLMQEFGLCTAPRDSEGVTIVDDFLGERRRQYLASEQEGATYYEGVVERLMCNGAAGAYAWCYADYDARLFDRPPLDRAIRERTFGLVRADGSEKPAAGVFRALRAKRDAGEVPRVEPASALDVTANEYYRAPGLHFGRLYDTWISRNE
jgi:endo-1,4-beta-mannosidase